MKSQEFKINHKSGLGSFPKLEKDFGITNYVAYDNSVWGNMNPSFAASGDEKEVIKVKDRKLADLIGSRFIVEIATPPEGTVIDLDRSMIDYLDFVNKEDEGGYKFVPVRANATILTVPQVGLVFAPRDCAIMLFVQNGWHGVICAHIGAPGAVQGLHHKILSYFKSLFSDVGVADFEVFVTPYICSKHYKLKEDKFAAFRRISPEVEPFISQTGGDRYAFDFLGLVKRDLKEKWGIIRFHESGLCTYEETERGNLFSYTLSKEDEKKFLHGGFNVAVSLRS